MVWPENPPLSYIVRWALRGREALCDPQGCDHHVQIRDDKGGLLRRLPCDDCPLQHLDSALSERPIIMRAFDLDFALRSGVHVTLHDINVEEFRALKIIRKEQYVLDKETAENAKHEASRVR